MKIITFLLLIQLILSTSSTLSSLLPSSYNGYQISRKLYDLIISSSSPSSSTTISSTKQNPKYRVSRKVQDAHRKLYLPVVTNWATKKCEKW